MFGKKKMSKGVDKMDKLITGIVIGGAVASMFGLAQKGKKKPLFGKIANLIAKKSLSGFSKILVKSIDLLSKKK